LSWLHSLKTKHVSDTESKPPRSSELPKPPLGGRYVKGLVVKELQGAVRRKKSSPVWFHVELLVSKESEYWIEPQGVSKFVAHPSTLRDTKYTFEFSGPLFTTSPAKRPWYSGWRSAPVGGRTRSSLRPSAGSDEQICLPAVSTATGWGTYGRASLHFCAVRRERERERGLQPSNPVNKEWSFRTKEESSYRLP
jgi:hypothetical protein